MTRSPFLPDFSPTLLDSFWGWLQWRLHRKLRVPKPCRAKATVW